MTEGAPQFLVVGTGASRRRIAYLHAKAATPGAPGILWLIGLKSDMASTKAEALAEWTRGRGLGFTRFDYSGHGRSEGRFEEATIGGWLEEAEAVLREVAQGPQIVVGSSTGAHMALILLRRLIETDPRHAARIKGLVLIAPAWDVTELIWQQLPDAARREIMGKGFWTRPSPYDPAGYKITRRFIEEGRRHLLAGHKLNPGRPVDVLQGQLDADVPPAHARRLKCVLAGDWVRITEVPDGEHRLSRPEDLEVLFRLIEGQLARAAA
jgi:alpha-beta hydrolase superfamily lysophospholipase